MVDLIWLSIALPALGAVALLPKPFDMDELVAKVRDLLPLREPPAQVR